MKDMGRFLLIISFIVSAFLVSSCSRSTADTVRSTANSNTSSSEKRYNFKGRIVSVDKAAKRATIEHDAIPGFMEAMTMDFPIHED